MTERSSFLGNNQALDFANTVDWRSSNHPHDRLGSYSDLVNWALQSGNLDRAQAAYLEQAQSARLGEAESAIATARILREAIYQLVLAAISGAPPAAPDLAMLNRFLREGLSRLKVTSSGAAYTLAWRKDDLLTEPLWAIAWAAAQLLASTDIRRVKQCASADGCAWLFLDRSKNLSRKWCDMRGCGNTAKARRYRASHRS